MLHQIFQEQTPVLIILNGTLTTAAQPNITEMSGLTSIGSETSNTVTVNNDLTVGNDLICDKLKDSMNNVIYELKITEKKLLASDGDNNDYFGYSVAISGNYAIVGAYLDNDKGNNSGSAYIFERDSSDNWTQKIKLLASDGLYNDYFGYSVAISGNYAIVGAYQVMMIKELVQVLRIFLSAIVMVIGEILVALLIMYFTEHKQ